MIVWSEFDVDCCSWVKSSQVDARYHRRQVEGTFNHAALETSWAWAGQDKVFDHMQKMCGEERCLSGARPMCVYQVILTLQCIDRLVSLTWSLDCLWRFVINCWQGTKLVVWTLWETSYGDVYGLRSLLSILFCYALNFLGILAEKDLISSPLQNRRGDPQQHRQALAWSSRLPSWWRLSFLERAMPWQMSRRSWRRGTSACQELRSHVRSCLSVSSRRRAQEDWVTDLKHLCSPSTNKETRHNLRTFSSDNRPNSWMITRTLSKLTRRPR